MNRCNHWKPEGINIRIEFICIQQSSKDTINFLLRRMYFSTHDLKGSVEINTQKGLICLAKTKNNVKIPMAK